mgnify:CR=1 FL=1
MDKSAILKGFNNQFEEFVEDICILFPNNKDIKTTKTALGMMRSANPRMICDVWYRYIYLKYEKEISEGNIEYFLTKDYSDDLQNAQTSNKALEAIEKLRQPLRELRDENKTKCLQYLNNLNKLSKIYFN